MHIILQAAANDFGSIVLLLMLLVAFAFYMLPTVVGRNKRNVAAIAALNLLLGWTVLGWIAALIWALTVDNDR